MAPEVKDEITRKGAIVVTAGHALSAGERGISSNFSGAYPLEIMAHTLRTYIGNEVDNDKQALYYIINCIIEISTKIEAIHDTRMYNSRQH